MQAIIYTGACLICGQPGELEVDETVYARYLGWAAQPNAIRPFIQDAFPELSAGDREQLLTGTHEKCFDLAFPDSGDED